MADPTSPQVESRSPSPSKKTEICDHIRIYEDGPNRWIVWDDYEEECPIFPTWESALAHAEQQAELGAMESEGDLAAIEQPPQVESGRDGLMACPTPWCGSTAIDVVYHPMTHNAWLAECCYCGVRATAHSQSAVIAVWNTRATDPATALLAECAEVMNAHLLVLPSWHLLSDRVREQQTAELNAILERIGRME